MVLDFSKSISKTRKSNIELLRIICMLLIISHHLLVHGIKIWDNTTFSNIPLLSIDSVCFVGVNVFVLISGYCGIKLRFGKIVRIWLMCAIVGGIGYFTHLLLDEHNLGRSVLFNTVFSISHPCGTWFIQEYFYLMLFSPIINKGLEHLSSKELGLILLIMTFINVYFGWFWQDDVNSDGYNIVNFIWIYCAGYYLRMYWKVQIPKLYYLLCWLVLSLINSFIAVSVPSLNVWAYNNPIIVISSISLFLFFIKLDFNSNMVNFVAQSCFGVYLIHENVYISKYIYQGALHSWYSDNPLYFVFIVLFIFIVCLIVDIIVRRCFVEPIMRLFERFITMEKVV